MTIKIILSVGIGIISGIFLKNDFLMENLNYFIDLGLCLLLFFVGIDIGKNKGIFKELKAMGWRITLLPVTIVAGTLFGGFISSFITGLSIPEAAAVSAGLGWYSLSAIELSKYSAELGSIAFLSNVCREIIAIIAIPFIGRYIGHHETIAAAGATSMDTLLPIITKSTTSGIAVVSFFTGVVLSSLVPILVPILISFQP